MKPTILACTSIGACATSFVTHAIPFLQFTALLISVVAGLVALIKHRPK